jgi:hypothetical protein
MSNDVTKTADEILSAMHRVWPQSAHRMHLARKFAFDRDVVTFEDSLTAYPMNISQLMAAKGWTAESFIRALY